MKNNAIYTTVSFVLTALLLIFVLALMLFAPNVTREYVAAFAPDLSEYYNTILLSIYASLSVAVVAVAALFRLLGNVYEHTVFSHGTYVIMTTLGVCCFLECVVFALLGLFFALSFVLSFASLFLGVLMLVLRHVLSEATSIKEENDYTV